MSKVTRAFRRVERANVRANTSVQPCNCALRQECLQRMKQQLYWVEVRRILRQVAEACTDSLDRLFHTCNLVEGDVVDHHNVLALERWDFLRIRLDAALSRVLVLRLPAPSGMRSKKCQTLQKSLRGENGASDTRTISPFWRAGTRKPPASSRRLGGSPCPRRTWCPRATPWETSNAGFPRTSAVCPVYRARKGRMRRGCSGAHRRR
jgi:hypothetical protein